MPNRKLNSSECELAEPHLPKPLARRVCRRSCVEWKTSDWSECDSQCGTGKRTRQVTCHRKVTGQMVENKWCLSKRRNLTRPISEEICQNRPCYSWTSSDQWTQCSATCNGGYQENIPRCTFASSSTRQIVSDYLCRDLIRPQNQRVCNTQSCIITQFFNSTRNHIGGIRGRGGGRRRRQWDVGPWSSCNVPCGVGEQYRTIRCLAILRNRIIPDRFCRHLPQPNRVQQCFQKICSPMWATSAWSSCSSICGTGIEYRGIACHEINNNGYLLQTNYSNQCDPYRAPTTRLSCNMGECDSFYIWHVEPWSKCSSDCNRGEQTRHVYCRNRQTLSPVHDALCISNKPVTRIDCYGFVFEYGQSVRRIC